MKNESIHPGEHAYYEYLSLFKQYLFLKIQYNLQVKFPLLFEKAAGLSEEAVTEAQGDFLRFESGNRLLLEAHYLVRLKKRLSGFEFELLMLLFYNIEDIKFNSVINKIKDPEKLPLSEDDFYGISLNEALELLVLRDRDKFILRKEFLTSSYLIRHKIINFPFIETFEENPLLFNENLLLSVHAISRIINMDKGVSPMKPELKFANRLKMGEEGF